MFRDIWSDTTSQGRVDRVIGQSLPPSGEILGGEGEPQFVLQLDDRASLSNPCPHMLAPDIALTLTSFSGLHNRSVIEFK